MLKLIYIKQIIRFYLLISVDQSSYYINIQKLLNVLLLFANN